MFTYLLRLALLVSSDEYDKQAACDSCRKFGILYSALAEEALAQGKAFLWQPKPKMHLLQELVEYQAQFWGSPKHFWCYRDESWCGFWAKAAHRRGGANNAATTTDRFLNRYRAFENDAFD